MPFWLYLLSAYAGLSLIKIRTFLEHGVHKESGGRRAIVEDRVSLALSFFNNNLHVVYHLYSRVPWYGLPTLYFANKAQYLSRNDGYVCRSYKEVLAQYSLRAKDPVPHPLWPQD